jgi:hypothetical protein
MGWVTENLLSQVPSCFRRHVKLLIPAFGFKVTSSHQSAMDPTGGLLAVLPNILPTTCIVGVKSIQKGVSTISTITLQILSYDKVQKAIYQYS